MHTQQAYRDQSDCVQLESMLYTWKQKPTGKQQQRAEKNHANTLTRFQPPVKSCNELL
jgi:hypothetical protein